MMQQISLLLSVILLGDVSGSGNTFYYQTGSPVYPELQLPPYLQHAHFATSIPGYLQQSQTQYHTQPLLQPPQQQFGTPAHQFFPAPQQQLLPYSQYQMGSDQRWQQSNTGAFNWNPHRYLVDLSNQGGVNPLMLYTSGYLPTGLSQERPYQTTCISNFATSTLHFTKCSEPISDSPYNAILNMVGSYTTQMNLMLQNVLQREDNGAIYNRNCSKENYNDNEDNWPAVSPSAQPLQNLTTFVQFEIHGLLSCQYNSININPLDTYYSKFYYTAVGFVSKYDGTIIGWRETIQPVSHLSRYHPR